MGTETQKVYIVFGDGWESFVIDGVFTNKQEATNRVIELSHYKEDYSWQSIECDLNHGYYSMNRY